jgi:SAM-dependent methyltransferase
MTEQRPKMYGDLAAWWPLLSPPDEYAEEAALYHSLLQETGAGPLRTMLELGSGGGNNAFHLKEHYELTLTDVSAGMLEVSRRLNPECVHEAGDMRSIRLERTFDAVFVHDAVAYMTTEEDLAAALATIAEHLRPGGAFLIAADDTAETFEEHTEHGGSGDEKRAIRYLQWLHSPDVETRTHIADYAYMLREGTRVWVEHDRHICGLFPRATWLRLLDAANLDARALTHTFSDGFICEIFVGRCR